jgi:hypothetical protein
VMTHGHSRRRNGRGEPSRTYVSWLGMKAKVMNRNASAWRYYGGAGIKVHRPWVLSFEQFLLDMGEKPPGDRVRLERIDKDGPFSPANLSMGCEAEAKAEGPSRATRSLGPSYG